MMISEIIVKQNDCPHIETTNKFKELYILVMHTLYVDFHQTMFSIFYSSNEKILDEAIRFFAGRHQVKNFMVISKQDNMATLFYTIDSTSLYRSLENIAAFRVHPVVVHNGVEKWFIISYNNPIKPENLINEKTVVLSMKNISQNKFLEDYSAIFSQFNIIKTMNKLSETEKKILLSAIELGYFDWPRKINMSKLSKKLKIPKSTLSYHFRLIEKKILNIPLNLENI